MTWCLLSAWWNPFWPTGPRVVAVRPSTVFAVPCVQTKPCTPGSPKQSQQSSPCLHRAGTRHKLAWEAAGQGCTLQVPPCHVGKGWRSSHRSHHQPSHFPASHHPSQSCFPLGQEGRAKRPCRMQRGEASPAPAAHTWHQTRSGSEPSSRISESSPPVLQLEIMSQLQPEARNRTATPLHKEILTSLFNAFSCF